MQLTEIVNWYGLALAVVLALPWFAFDMVLHLVLGFGIIEVYIMAAHWAFVIPVAAAYLLLRVVFSKREKKQIAILIVASSAAVVILSGILQVNTLLLTAGIVYLIGELYIVKCKF